MSTASNPSRLLLMVETQSPADSMITVDNGGASFTDHVRPMQTNTMDSLVRHGGSVNVVFLDGHVSTYSFSETNYSDAQNKVVMDRWFTL
jgi:prepilin-type processing-associated H-X9-DG protein